MNQAVLETVDAIISADEGAIVILMSDHGSQRTGSPSVYALRSFFAARMPSDREQYEEQRHTVVSDLAAYKRRGGGERHAIPAWLSAPLEPLTLTRYTGQEP